MSYPSLEEKLAALKVSKPTAYERTCADAVAPGEYEIAVQRTADILDEGYEIFMRSSRSSMGVAGDSIVAIFNAAGDLVNASEAAKVKSDLVADGQIELQATRTGDGSHLTEADTGNNLVRLRSVLARNAADGVTEDFTNQLTKVTVGKLADPNDPTVTWCVEEIGTSRITYSRTSDGSVVRTQLIKFDDRFWLILQSGHYLITDVQVSSQVIS